jgi:NADH dehydrogenase FAD-containing subunit
MTSRQLHRRDASAGQRPVSGRQKKNFPFPVTEKGFTATDAALRVSGHPHVFAIGDIATAEAAAAGIPGAALPATAQVWNLVTICCQSSYL